MTNTVTFRCRTPKRLLLSAFGNVSERLNQLVERELAGSAPPPDWRDALREDRPLVEDAVFERCLRPE